MELFYQATSKLTNLSFFILLRPKVKTMGANMKPLFKLPSPCAKDGCLSFMSSVTEAPSSPRTAVTRIKDPIFSQKAQDMLRRRPDINEALLEALECSVNENLMDLME